MLPPAYRFIGACMLLTALGACARIPLEQEDVFLPKPSITPQDVRERGLQVEEVFFPAADSSVTLNAWYLSQPEAEATVLFFGGQGFYLVQSAGYVEALTSLPLNVFMVDYRGYGKSEGTPSVEALKADALVAYDVVVRRYQTDPRRLLVHGHSLGTFIALHTAAERAVAGAILENPATDVQGWTRSVLPWFMRLFVRFEIDADLKGESNLGRARAFTGPLLVFGGEEDAITPPELAEALYEAAASADKELVIVEGGEHNGLYEAGAYRDAYRRFLGRAVPR